MTWDPHTDRRIAHLHPMIRQAVTDFIDDMQAHHGKTIRVTDGLRTFDEQTALYAKGRTAAGSIVTQAAAGESYHNYGLAFDVVEIHKGAALWHNRDWELIGKEGELAGFEWGGRRERPVGDVQRRLER